MTGEALSENFQRPLYMVREFGGRRQVDQPSTFNPPQDMNGFHRPEALMTYYTNLIYSVVPTAVPCFLQCRTSYITVQMTVPCTIRYLTPTVPWT